MGQYAGGLASEGPLSSLLRDVSIASGFNEYTGCFTSVRIDTAIDINKIGKYGGHVFVKAEAYCEKPKPHYPPVHPPYVPPYKPPVKPPVHPPYVPPYKPPIKPPVHPIYPPFDPCDCSKQHLS